MSFIINIEGIDGSGKGTQSARLLERLKESGRSATIVSFPRYQLTSFGKRIADFLNGRFGDLNSVHPYLAAALYAGDRFESRIWLQEQIASHDVVILDRYVASNMAHQGSKLAGQERTELMTWIEQVEFGIYGLPKPNVSILLDIPANVAQSLIAKKAPRQYTSQAADLQESDSTHLSRTRETYQQLAQSGQEWLIISCTDSTGTVREIDDISNEIWLKMLLS